MHSVYPRMRCVREVVNPLRKKGTIGKLLGAGSFSVVYEAPERPDSVLKLTKCDAFIGLMEELPKYDPDETRHFPRMHEFLGKVGHDPYDGTSLYGYWLERLRKPTRQEHAAVRLRKALCESLGIDNSHLIRLCDREPTEIGGYPLPASLLKSLNTLRSVYETLNFVMLDLHNANVMVRPSTGELVLSDPLLSA